MSPATSVPPRSVVRFADLTIGMLGVVCLGLGLYVAIVKIPHGAWEWVQYYGPVGAGVCACMALRCASETVRVRSSILLHALVVALYAAELFLTFRPPFQLSTFDLAARAGMPSDRRTDFQVIDALAAAGKKAYPFANYSAVKVDGKAYQPLSGAVRYSNIVYCNESGRWIRFDSDRYGFRNPDAIYNARTMDIAAIGDSFVTGCCVESNRCFVSLIRDQFPSTINLGKNGSGPITELAILREYAAPLKPRLVLWFFYEGNDVSDLEWEKKTPILQDYTHPGFVQGVRAIHESIDVQMRRVAEAKGEEARREERRKQQLATRPRTFSLVNFIFLRRLRLLLSQPATPSEFDRPLFQNVMTQARDEVAAWGGQLVFVYLPGGQRYKIEGWRPDPFPFRGAVLEVVGALGVPIIDMVPVFQASVDPMGLFPFGVPGTHYNQAGHRLVGQTVNRWLLSRRLPVLQSRSR